MGKIILRLDRVMADRKISLKELSEKVGVSNVNLSKMKTGKISAIRFAMRWIVSPETSLNIVLKIKTHLNHRGPLFA